MRQLGFAAAAPAERCVSCFSTAFASIDTPGEHAMTIEPAGAAVTSDDAGARRRHGRRGERFQPGDVPAVEGFDHEPNTADFRAAAARRAPFVLGQPVLQTLRPASASSCDSSWRRSTAEAVGRQHGQRRTLPATASRYVRSALSAGRRTRTSDAMPPRSRSTPSTAISADGAGSLDVRAAAGATGRSPSISMSRSVPSRAGSFRSGRLAASSCRHEADRDRAVLPDDAIGVVDGALDLRGRRPRAPGRSSRPRRPCGSSTVRLSNSAIERAPTARAARCAAACDRTAASSRSRR